MDEHKEKSSQRWSDFEMEQLLGNLLRIGVWVAAAVVTVGAVFYLTQHGLEEPHYRVFQGEPDSLRKVTLILSDAFALHGRHIIQLGLLLLIATPVMRVLFAVLFFALQRDYLYLVISLIVLGLLALGLSGITST